MAEQSDESFDSNWLGECDICLEDVSEKKLLACGHDFCLNCLNLLCAKPGSSFFNAHLSILICPSCSQETKISRASLNSLPSQFFGGLKCGFCHVGKPVDEMWWCLSCVKIICSKCDVKNHRKYQHEVSEWSSLKGIKDCCRLLLQDFNLESQLNKFFSKVTKEIVKKVSYSSQRLHLADKLCHAYGLEITDDVDQLDPFPYHEREDVTAEVITAVKEALSLANFPKTVADELEKALKRSEKNETTFKLGNILSLKVAEMVITEARKPHQVPAPTHPKNKTGRCSTEVAGIKVKETSRLQQTVPSLSQKVSATRANNSGKLKASPALAAAAADGNGWWPSEFPILSPVPNSRNERTSSRPQAEMMSEETIQPLTIKKTCALDEFSHYSKPDSIHSHNRSTYSQVVSHGRQQEHPLPGAITPDLETFSLNTKKLAEVRLHEQKQVLGEQLFPLIHQLYPDLAGKLTGMLLEMDNSELVMMLEEPNLLRTNVEGAVKVLLKSLLWDVSGEREWVVQNSISPDQEPEVMISTTPSAQALHHEEKRTGIGRENNVSIKYTDGMG